MKTDTKLLIRELVENAVPVRRPAGPCARAMIWLGISLAYIGVFVLLMPARQDVTSNQRGLLFVIEQAAAFLTGVTAAIAAFVSVVPGFSRKWIALPIVPLL